MINSIAKLLLGGRPAFLVAVTLFCVMFAASAQTTNYVSVSGSGNQSGSDWNNTLPGSFTPVRGRYYYLADGSYGGKTWSTATSGSTLIYIIKATEANHGTSTGWSSAFGDGVAQYSAWTVGSGSQYWHFDGNNAPGGDRGCGFAVANSASPFYFVRLRSGNLFVKHLEVDGTGSSVDGFGIAWEGPNTTIRQCYVHNTPNDAITDDGTFGGTGNYVVEGCYIGPRGDSGGTHGDMFTHQISSGGVFRTNIVEWNGQLLWFAVPGPNSGTYEIYGNVISAGPQTTTPSGSCTVLKAHSSGDGDPAVILFYNNTVVNVNDFANTYGDGASIFRNNLFYDLNASSVGFGSKTHSHNWFQTGISYGTEATAQTGGDPFVSYNNSNFALKNNTDAGTVLGSPYNVDMFGRTRTTWTRGAIEFATGSTNPVTNPIISISPASLDFGSIAVGTATDLTFAVRNIGAGTLTGTASVSTPFSIVSGATYSLGSNQSQTVTVRYTPAGAGNHSQTVTFTGGGGASAGVSGSAWTVLAGLSFESVAGVITLPFVANVGGYISQPSETGLAGGGRAVYAFTIANAADYIISASVNAPSSSSDSFFINVDAEPTDPAMIWDIPLTSGFEDRIVSWRGNGTFDSPQYPNKVFTLAAGTHQLIVRGREGGVQLGRISIAPVAATPPSPPSNLQILAGP